jgi:alcohol dehydrogenase class IV
MHVSAHRFGYELPTRIEFGAGVAGLVGEPIKELGGSRVLVITDPGVAKAGIADRVAEPLSQASVAYELYQDVTAEPEAAGVEAGVDAARAMGADVVVGVGGGSVLDTAKAVAVMITNEGHIRDYEGQDRIPQPGLPVIALPTTAGTGSEVTVWAVITESDCKAKYGIASRHLCAKVALCDPELTTSLPPRMTATTGLDALAHALESYVNRVTQPLSEALSTQAMQMIGRSLRTAVLRGDDLHARAEMLLASTMAAMAFNPTRLGIAHALAMPLGAKHKIPHSVVISILLPDVVAYNAAANLEKFTTIARLLGERVTMMSARDAADRAAIAIRRLRDDLMLSETLSAYGVKEADLRPLAEEALLSGNVAVNPRTSTVEDLMGVMRAAM